MPFLRYCLILLLSLLPVAAQADGLAEIRSQASLDEPRGYCVDMVGSQARASAERPLQAHTCYAYQGRVAVDQGVSIDEAAQGRLRFPHFGVCLAGASAHSGGTVRLIPCAESGAADIVWDGRGRIMPKVDESLCLTVGGGASRPGGGGNPPHLIRALTWEACAPDEPRQAWLLRP